jgi:hypothetical protein
LQREDREGSDLRERFNVFLAIHIPGRSVALRAGMTLVNLYRLALRDGLGVQLEELPSRTIFTRFSTPLPVRGGASSTVVTGLAPLLPRSDQSGQSNDPQQQGRERSPRSTCRAR